MHAANVTILSSQFPGAVRRDLLDSLRARQINHKFHYDSIKQAEKWLALHDAVAPSRRDADCLAAYDAGFAAAAQGAGAGPVHLIGLGCGGGQKDARLLALLRQSGTAAVYTPSDVSVALVLVALENARSAAPGIECFPTVCDLATELQLPQTLGAQTPAQASRLLTFFGMIPNFEPDVIVPRLGELLRGDDLLLFSANLAPGLDYTAGVQKILPQYDNELTRDWLMTFLTDLGVERADGRMTMRIEDGQAGLKRVVADFQFARDRRIVVGEGEFKFGAGDSIRLFYSYRYTPQQVNKVLAKHGISVLNRWVTSSDEEGVFLCQKA